MEYSAYFPPFLSLLYLLFEGFCFVLFLFLMLKSFLHRISKQMSTSGYCVSGQASALPKAVSVACEIL